MNTYVNEIHEVFIRTVHQVIQVLVSWHPNFTSRIWSNDWIIVIIEEHLPSARPGQHRSRRYSLHLHHQRHVVFFIFSREQGVPNIQFIEDAPKAPHIDGRVVRDPEDDFWCPVKSGLDVGIDLLVLEATAPKVYDFDT